MNKEEICYRINAVCRILDGGITVSGVQNAGNLAGCYSILQEILNALSLCDIVLQKQEDK